MSKALIAALIAVLVTWLLRRGRPAAEATAPDTELWGAFDRGEDPTAD
jgi:hypothetical protein